MNALQGFEERLKNFFSCWEDANEGCPDYDPADDSEDVPDSCTETYDPSDEPIYDDECH